MEIRMDDFGTIRRSLERSRAVCLAEAKTAERKEMSLLAYQLRQEAGSYQKLGEWYRDLEADALQQQGPIP